MIPDLVAARLGAGVRIGETRQMRSPVRCSVALLIGSALAVSCAGTSTDLGEPAEVSSAGRPGSTVEGTGSTAENLPVGDLVVTPNPNNELSALVTVESPVPVSIELTATSGDHVVQVPRTASPSTSTDIPLVGLRSERDYELTAELTDENGAVVGSADGMFTSGAIPERFGDYDFTADPERSSPGYTVIEMQHWRDPASATPQRPFDEPQYLIALDDEGEIVWYYENGPLIGAVEQTADGTFTSIFFPTGMREFDMMGNDVNVWEVPLENAEGPSSTGVTDGSESLPVDSDDVLLELVHHEANRMSNGNLLLLSTAHHALTPEQRSAFCPGDPEPFGVFSDVAVEFEPSGRVVRTWDLWDVIDVDEVPGEEMCNERFAVKGDRDWTHANAVVYDEERDAVIFSVRHTSQVIAMTRTDREGPQTEVRWILGEGATMPLDGDVPRYQHAVEVQDDGSILLYDNGNGREGTEPDDPTNPTYSRAVLYAIDDTSPDPADWSATQVWEHRADDLDGEPIYASFIGDADRVANGNVLITHGGIDFMNPESNLHSVIIEVVPDGAAGGDVVWEFRAGSTARPTTTYRAERIESFYIGPDWVSPS